MTVPGDHVLVMGAGRSPLVAQLVEAGRSVVAVDISQVAVEQLLAELGDAGLASAVTGIVADAGELPELPPVRAWHDRAVFHFITEAERQAQYMAAAAASVVPGGHVVLAEFSVDGPTHCSGLEVCRHSEQDLAALAADDFEWRECEMRTHETPWGATQSFLHVMLERVALDRNGSSARTPEKQNLNGGPES